MKRRVEGQKGITEKRRSEEKLNKRYNDTRKPFSLKKIESEGKNTIDDKLKLKTGNILYAIIKTCIINSQSLSI